MDKISIFITLFAHHFYDMKQVSVRYKVTQQADWIIHMKFDIER